MNTSVASAVSTLVTLKDGKPVTTSRVVAESFDKNHRDVLRSIDAIIESPVYRERNQRNFARVDYLDAKGERRPMYEMDRQGFEILAMGFTGEEALRWKFKYSDAFAAMEAALLNPQAAPAAPPPRKPIRSRRDLSFTQRDSEGRLKNWVVEHDPKGNWHVGFAIGQAYFAEVLELAAHDPEEARWAIKSALIEGAALNWPRGGWGIECGFAEALASALFATPPHPAPRAGRPPSLTAQRRFDSGNAWLPAVQAYLADRKAVTLTEILLHLNVEPNQRAKNRLSKLLQGLSWRLHVTSVQGNGCRVYRND